MRKEVIGNATLYLGDTRDVMRHLIAEGVKAQTVVTSPPYWGLRWYCEDAVRLDPSLSEEDSVAMLAELRRRGIDAAL